MCFIKVYGINVILCLLQTLQGVGGREDQLMLVSTAGPVVNLTGFGGALVVSLTAVNVQNSNVSDKLKVLSRQLLRQEDAGCHHYDGFRSIGLEFTQSITDAHKGLAAASGHDHLTLGILQQGSKSTFLVRAKLDHVLRCV